MRVCKTRQNTSQARGETRSGTRVRAATHATTCFATLGMREAGRSCLQVGEDALGASRGLLRAEAQPLQAVGRGIQRQLQEKGAGAGGGGEEVRHSHGRNALWALDWAAADPS